GTDVQECRRLQGRMSHRSPPKRDTIRARAGRKPTAPARSANKLSRASKIRTSVARAMRANCNATALPTDPSTNSCAFHDNKAKCETPATKPATKPMAATTAMESDISLIGACPPDGASTSRRTRTRSPRPPSAAARKKNTGSEAQGEPAPEEETKQR